MSLPRLLLPLLCLVLASCESFENDDTMISVHAQGTDMDNPRTIMPDVFGSPPRKVILERSPLFSDINIAAVHPFPADDGTTYGVALKLDFKGTQALELATRMRQGEYLRTIVNGRGVDYVRIDRPITDGIFTIWQGVTEGTVKDLQRSHPPINQLRSAASNQDMTPSTKKEKKAAMDRYRREGERAELPSHDAPPPAPEPVDEREAAAQIEAPAPSYPTANPNPPLPQ